MSTLYNIGNAFQYLKFKRFKFLLLIVVLLLIRSCSASTRRAVACTNLIYVHKSRKVKRRHILRMCYVVVLRSVALLIGLRSASIYTALVKYSR